MNGPIDLGQSISYIFDDKDWVTKIGILLLVNIAFGMLAFILVGFVFLAAQYAWIIELIRNMQAGDETPMPGWDNFTDKIQLGLAPLGAFIVYMIIPFIASCLLFAPAILAGSVNENAGGIFGLGVSCLLIPLILVYIVVAWFGFTIGMIRYARTENIGEFFKFSNILQTAQRHSDATVRYVIFVVVVQFVLSLAGSTGIGGLVAGAFATPVLGHLMGQYAMAIDGGKKKKIA